jgi:hypothetical protein
MLGWLKRSWHKAQALSVLQLAYRMPFKEPLDRLTDADLKACVRLVLNVGGTPYDTAVSFMILRADNAIRLGQLSEDQHHVGHLMGVGWATRDQMKLWDQHVVPFKRLGEMAALKQGGHSPRTTDISST